MDIDFCIDKESQKVESRAWELVKQLDSYTEISPSGKGLHVLLEAPIPDYGLSDDQKIELYDKRKFITFTGRHVSETPTVIKRRPAEVRDIYKEWISEEDHDLEKTPEKKIGDIKSGEIVNFTGRVTNEDYFKYGKIRQRGTLEDETGEIQFVIWRDVHGLKLDLLEEGNTYLIQESRAYEYEGKLQTELHLSENVIETDGI
ncbi:hypothetical protein [Halorussus pelagicus]|uniref:hypothetical protein n=1 Tax=Halorussus pelagicus TaxID=2505977 RepID=UPI000FFB3A15|nr:hypothetical protein [Halorussus pelagicus]